MNKSKFGISLRRRPLTYLVWCYLCIEAEKLILIAGWALRLFIIRTKSTKRIAMRKEDYLLATTDQTASALFELLRNSYKLLSYLSYPAIQVKARLFDYTNLCNSIDKALCILRTRSKNMTYLIDIGILSALIF